MAGIPFYGVLGAIMTIGLLVGVVTGDMAKGVTVVDTLGTGFVDMLKALVTAIFGALF